MKKTLFIFSVFVQIFAFGQTKVPGSYHESSGNPDDGGYNWFLLEDQHFAMFTFGQMIAGKWNINSENIITFTPFTAESPFEVYGRFSDNVKGTKIMFSNFDINEDAFIGNTENGLQPVLSEDANCLPYPLLNIFENSFKNIVLSCFLPENGTAKEQSYIAEIPEYNDFIVMYYSSRSRIPPFRAKLENNRLFFEYSQDPTSERKNIKNDELKEIENYLSRIETAPREDLVITKGYNFISYGIFDNDEKFDEKEFLKYNYDYDASKETYTAKEQRETEKDDDYHNFNVLWKYKNIPLKPAKPDFKKSKTAVFNITCEN